MRNFTQLKVWQKAHQLVLSVYRHSRDFPAEERFGLTAHLVKSAVSIPSNIAEGCGREGDKELARLASLTLHHPHDPSVFLSIAAGSASETEYQLLLARDLAYLSPQSHQELDDQVNEVKRMLNAFIQRLAEKGDQRRSPS